MFVDIISAVRFDIPPTERQPEVRALLNTNQLIRPGQHFNPSVVGGKTGFTIAAGHTLVTYAAQDGRRLIVSVLGSTSPAAFVDTTALLNFGFALPFEQTKIFDAAANIPTVPVYSMEENVRTEIGRVALQAADNLYFDLPMGFDMGLLNFNLSIPHALVAPVRAGENLGSVAVYIQGMRIGRAPLLAVGDVGEALAAVPPAAPAPVAEYVAYEYAATPAAGGGYVYEYENTPPPFWQTEYLLLLAIPLVISVVTLLVSLIIFLAGRRRRMRRMLHMRYARYPQYYRYK